MNYFYTKVKYSLLNNSFVHKQIFYTYVKKCKCGYESPQAASKSSYPSASVWFVRFLSLAVRLDLKFLTTSDATSFNSDISRNWNKNWKQTFFSENATAFHIKTPENKTIFSIRDFYNTFSKSVANHGPIGSKTWRNDLR